MKPVPGRWSVALAVPAIVTGLSGCQGTGATYEPVIDAPRDAKYQTDLYECQKLAEQRGYFNADTATDGLVGAGVGALAGGISGGSPGDAVAGAALGGLVGTSGRAYAAREEMKNIVRRCMAGRNYRVLN